MGKKCEAMSNKVYINSVAHISMQQPLSRESVSYTHLTLPTILLV